MRVSAGVSSSWVSPPIGWMKRPSTVSSAALVRYARARALGVEGGDARMRVVGGPVDLLRLAPEVALVDLLDDERAQRGALVPDQHDPVADLTGLAIEGHGDRPRPPVREPHRLGHRLPGRVPLEPVERGEAAVGQELEVGRLAG